MSDKMRLKILEVQVSTLMQLFEDYQDSQEKILALRDKRIEALEEKIAQLRQQSKEN